MQTIESKLSRVLPIATAAGLSADQARHLIHGTGGSPRRAKRAIRLGIHGQLIEAYEAALEETGAHASALSACNGLWADLVPTESEEPDASDEALVAPAIKPLAESMTAFA